jgi:hypothetical protein
VFGGVALNHHCGSGAEPRSCPGICIVNRFSNALNYKAITAMIMRLLAMHDGNIQGNKWQPVGESNPSFQVENLTS